MKEKIKDSKVRKISDDDLSYVAGGLDTAYVKEMIKNRIIEKHSEFENVFKKNSKNFDGK